VSVVDKEFTLILANTSLRSWLLALGWSNDIIGKKIPDAFPFLSPSVLDEYRTVFSTGMMMVTEETSKIGNAEIATETQKIPLKEHGNVVAVIAVIRDITKRKRDWEALRKANRKLNLLSGITRHDIKNQLLSLNGFLEISKKYLGDAAKTSEFIGKEEKILKILERQITFTKEYEAVGVNAPVWQDCRTLVETAATQVLLGIDLVNNDLPAGLEVFADPLIVKVCYNLMDNAVHHGGKITTIRFFMEERDGDHIVVCEDDGIGIPADEKEKIFERGFGKNTGIGLFLAREILSITGITITENGEPGKGARFEMTVPKGAWRFIHP
jgi:signal transduction histidine kinase